MHLYADLMLKKHFLLLLMLMLLNNFVKLWYTTIQKIRVSKKKKLLFSKDGLNWSKVTVKTFIVLQKLT